MTLPIHLNLLGISVFVSEQKSQLQGKKQVIIIAKA